jgi:hypothetical protein
MFRDKTLFYKKGYKYWVTRPYRIKLDIHPSKILYISFKTVDLKGNIVEIPMVTLNPSGLLIVYPSYVWDGASGPTWDTKNSMIGSLIHDVIYQLIRLGFIDSNYKEYADKILHDLCEADGMYSCRARLWWLAVTLFGRNAIRPSSEHLEEVAP